MTLNERLIAALVPMGLPVSPDIYSGDAQEYITFNFDLIPFRFADNVPQMYRALVQVHYYCPMALDSVQRRENMKVNLVRAGFGWPEEINATTDRRIIDGIQHYTLESECMMPVERIEGNGDT